MHVRFLRRPDVCCLLIMTANKRSSKVTTTSNTTDSTTSVIIRLLSCTADRKSNLVVVDRLVTFLYSLISLDRLINIINQIKQIVNDKANWVPQRRMYCLCLCVVSHAVNQLIISVMLCSIKVIYIKLLHSSC